jgi:preprotein translocase subunit SecD
MRRAVLAAAFAAILFTGAGCDNGNKPELHDAIRLKAVPPPGHALTRDDVDRSVEIMQQRLDKLGIESKVRRQGDDVIVIALPAGTARKVAAAPAVGKTGLLEFYDFEAALRGRSVTHVGPAREPVARSSLAALLGKRRVVPQGTVVVSCTVAAGKCLSTRPVTTRKAFYLFTNNPSLTGSDLQLSGTRADLDPNTGQPVVLVQFTDRAKRTFQQITQREAKRGAQICAGRRDSAAVQECAQHFAIVLDHEIVSIPYIDFVQNPDGIPAENGVQIQLPPNGSLRDAKRIAVALQTGALPVRFVRLP